MRSVQLGTITTTVWLLSLLAQTTLARVLPASQLPVRRAGEGVNGGRHSTISIIQPRAMGEKFNPLEYFDDDDLELDSFNRCVDDCEQGKVCIYLFYISLFLFLFGGERKHPFLFQCSFSRS